MIKGQRQTITYSGHRYVLERAVCLGWIRVLKGRWQGEGALLEPASLVLKRVDGLFICLDTGGELTAHRRADGVQIICSRSAWVFWPDAGECERVKLPVQECTP
jgi:hypothetical protein